MDNKTIIALARLASGVAIFITSMVTGVNGTYQGLALVLMGVPFEALQTTHLSDKELNILKKYKEAIATAKASQET